MEQMDMYKEQTEGSLKKFFEMFQKGKTNEEVMQYFPKSGINIPEQYMTKAKKYFEDALEYNPKNYVLNNYNVVLQKSIDKYPYTPTEKPEILEYSTNELPSWIKNTAFTRLGISGQSYPLQTY